MASQLALKLKLKAVDSHLMRSSVEFKMKSTSIIKCILVVYFQKSTIDPPYGVSCLHVNIYCRGHDVEWRVKTTPGQWETDTAQVLDRYFFSFLYCQWTVAYSLIYCTYSYWQPELSFAENAILDGVVFGKTLRTDRNLKVCWSRLSRVLSSIQTSILENKII